mmetsp:Transcript_13209/g.23067  ORF Transcript_13209/g.23067 Transcript_13209/m.23067 type:complete len:146 (-) Transcript_13209:249-686(-)
MKSTNTRSFPAPGGNATNRRPSALEDNRHGGANPRTSSNGGRNEISAAAFLSSSPPLSLRTTPRQPPSFRLEENVGNYETRIENRHSRITAIIDEALEIVEAAPVPARRVGSTGRQAARRYRGSLFDDSNRPGSRGGNDKRTGKE